MDDAAYIEKLEARIREADVHVRQIQGEVIDLIRENTLLKKKLAAFEANILNIPGVFNAYRLKRKPPGG